MPSAKDMRNVNNKNCLNEFKLIEVFSFIVLFLMKVDTKQILKDIYSSISGDKTDVEGLVFSLLMMISENTDCNMTSLSKYLNTNDYFTAPGSAYYHDDHPMGLVKHSLQVTFWAIKYFRTFFKKSDQTDENLCWLILACLCHDLCKVNRFETTLKWKKDDQGNWASYDAYSVREDYKALGHGSESMRRLYYLCPNIPYKVQEAIYWHMGLFDSDDTQGYSKAYKEEPLVLCLVTADMLSTQRSIELSDIED